MVERGEKVIRPPPVETKIPESLAGPKAKEIGLHPAPVGSQTARQVPMATPEAEIEIQVKPLNPVQTKEMLQDHRVKVREILHEPLSLVRAEGVATVEVHHPAAVAHRVDQVSGADQVSDADRDYVENALNPADDPFQDEWIDESGCVHNVNAATGGQNA